MECVLLGSIFIKVGQIEIWVVVVAMNFIFLGLLSSSITLFSILWCS